MENQILDYAHSLDWSESQVDAMKAWLSSTWMALEGDEPDQDFLEYIMVRSIPNVGQADGPQ